MIIMYVLVGNSMYFRFSFNVTFSDLEGFERSQNQSRMSQRNQFERRKKNDSRGETANSTSREETEHLESMETLKMKVEQLESQKRNHFRTMQEHFGVSPQMIISMEKKEAQLKHAEQLLEIEEKFHDQIEDYQEKIHVAKSFVFKVRQMKGYKTKEDVRSLKADIAETKKRKFAFQMDDCAICLDLPAEGVRIYTCQRCAAIFCRPCVVSSRDGRFKVDKCPICQVPLNQTPLARNKFVEKCMMNYHSL